MERDEVKKILFDLHMKKQFTRDLVKKEAIQDNINKALKEYRETLWQKYDQEKLGGNKK